MRITANPFTDPGQVHGPLYATADRLARRTSAMHRAREGRCRFAMVGRWRPVVPWLVSPGLVQAAG